MTDLAERTHRMHRSLERHLPFEPTVSQAKVLVALSRFAVSVRPRCCLILSGYAGTGKTSMMVALVRTISEFNGRFALMAPTGRAAKVLSNYTGRRASTIHRQIYRRMPSGDGGMRFALKENKWKRCLFIVDEASMIGTGGMMGRDLLEDMMEYVYNGEECRLLLIGDTAQLPPVHSDESPALDMDLLDSRYDLTIAEVKLTEVVRQAAESGILSLATALRHAVLGDTNPLQTVDFSVYPDVECINGQEMLEILEEAYDKTGIEQVKVICRSNKNANDYNKHIRSRTLYLEEELAAGDQLMVVKNNYHWVDEQEEMGFIANGDMAEVEYVKSYKEMYDLRFATVGLRFIDYPEVAGMEINILLDVLSAEGPSLPEERATAFYHAVREDHAHLGSRVKIKEAMRMDPWYNALQVKYGNAITCHKSQGGQWPVVFVDRGYVTEEMMDKGYWRWLYTAVTRATDKLYLVNFDPRQVAADKTANGEL